MWDVWFALTAGFSLLVLSFVGEILSNHDNWDYVGVFVPYWILIGVCCCCSLVPLFIPTYNNTNKEFIGCNYARSKSTLTAIIFSTLLSGLVLTTFILATLKLDGTLDTWTSTFVLATVLSLILLLYFSTIVLRTCYSDDRSKADWLECCRMPDESPVDAPRCLVGFGDASQTGNAIVIASFVLGVATIVMTFLHLQDVVGQIVPFIFLWLWLSSLTVVSVLGCCVATATAEDDRLTKTRFGLLLVFVVGGLVSSILFLADLSPHEYFAPLYVALGIITIVYCCFLAVFNRELRYDAS